MSPATALVSAADPFEPASYEPLTLLPLARVRPKVRMVSHQQWRSVNLLGLLCAGLSVSSMSALEVLPLGTAVASDFLGPLAVTVCRRRGQRRVAWQLTALLGVFVMTTPWHGGTPLRGVALASAAAACWAGTIVLTSRVGAKVEGRAGPRLDGGVVALGLALAVLMPVLPYLLEVSALRRLPEPTFSTLMACEPALGVLVAALVLGQRPRTLWAAGILLVAASVGTTRRVGSPSRRPRGTCRATAASG